MTEMISSKIEEVVLIGNYPNDQMRSMDQFAETLRSQLTKSGQRSSIIRPEPFFGKLKKSPTGFGKWLGYIDKFILFPKTLRKITKLNKNKSIIYHICDQSNAHYIEYLPPQKTVTTVHDLMAIQASLGAYHQIQVGWTGKTLQKIILRGLRKSTHFTCVSEATKNELTTLVPESQPHSIHLIPNAIVQETNKETNTFVDEQINRRLKMKRFILHVGNDNWYKNRQGLFEIFDQLRRLKHEDLYLVLIGPPPSEKQKKNLSPDSIKQILDFQNVDKEDLNLFYKKAELLIFPSILEGFGWPILEAFSSGCPVSIIQKPPMTEIAGNLGYYLSDLDEFNNWKEWVLDSAYKLNIFLLNEGLKESSNIEKRLKRSQHFSPESIFPRYSQVYQSLIEQT